MLVLVAVAVVVAAVGTWVTAHKAASLIVEAIDAHRRAVELAAVRTEANLKEMAASIDGFWTGLPTQQPTFVDVEALLAAEGLDKDPEFSELVLESEMPVTPSY